MTVAIDGVMYRVKWDHRQAFRGETTCVIEVSENDAHVLHAVGEAHLHPNDNYSRNRGRRVSLSRALAGFAKRERAAFWSAYREQLGHW